MNENQKQKYLRKLDDCGCEIADEYKNSLIPDKLYKYYPLDDTETERNKRNFKSLLNEKLWISSHKTFNDFVEFESLHIDDVEMNEKGFKKSDIEKVRKVFDEAKKTVLISCFSKSYKNHPMWAHYANEHKGFCVEYDVIRKRNFYPVYYNFKRKDFHEIMLRLISNHIKIFEIENKGIPSVYADSIFIEENLKMISLMYFNYFTKSSKWSSEEEVRLIFSEEKPFEDNGKLLDYHHAKINPRGLIVGNKCTEYNEKVLKAISQRIGVARVERFNVDFNDL